MRGSQGASSVLNAVVLATPPRQLPIAPSTEEVSVPMSIPDSGSVKNGGVKTLAIRLEPELHQQLSLVAGLRNRTITDEIRTAIEQHINTLKANPDLAAKADSALADIERDAAARRTAITTLFGEQAAAPPPASSTRTRGGKAATKGGDSPSA